MTRISVFEDPWSNDRAKIPLETSTIKHIQLIEIFLKLLPHFQKNDKNQITIEALVYSEWRYVNYIRFLDYYGMAANDFPPPWDVAMIWYCHLLSPHQFHRHLWDSQHTSYGLNHHHFPLTHLLYLYNSGKWSHPKARKHWNRWNRTKSSPGLPFQLWDSPPWETKRKSSLFSIFSGKPSSKPASGEKAEEPTIRFYSTWCRTSGKKEWKLSQYTDLRRGKRPMLCINASRHSRYGARCELTPWPSLEDFRNVINRQTCFWKAVIKARDSDPNFASKPNLEIGLSDYEKFIKLHGQPPRLRQVPNTNVWRVDMNGLPSPDKWSESRNREFVPPTLLIDLLWHTHRLYPASYWTWSFNTAGRLIDYEHTSSAVTAKRFLEETDLEWKKRNGFPVETRHTMEEFRKEGYLYIPDAAIVPPGYPARVPIDWTLGGTNPVKGRRRGYKGQYYVCEGIFITFDGGSGDGGGGGDGGCGGDGGGGGGDGGGC
ncbi:uncharacterized protein CTRU02_213087 [Colletotrichum truncatum]|uniref:Uncharacterized protein n=1 Tax=Colletotrichum truncatum TaxID=5467 RepID=A0ACC3YJR4_COLTU|nr:uncharacterized protein CTRU02_03409 [Colletotrichum truncatum]KAF6797378.1 hypothetical protein CTRU02_03409 [Colletotrichum truncatum]